MKIKILIFIAVFIVLFGCKNHKTDKILKHANRAIQVNEFEQAIGFYDQVLEINPTDITALFNKSIANINLLEYEKALITLDLLLQDYPSYEKAIYQKAMVLYQLKQYDKSVGEFSKIINSSVFDQNELLFYKGLSLFAKGHYILSLQDFNSIDNNSQYAIDANMWLGIIYEKMNDWESAIKKYKYIVSKGDEAAKIYYRLGICNLALDKKFYAKYYFSSAIQLEPLNSEAILKRALVNFDLKYFKAAAKDFSSVIEIDSTKQIPALKGRISSFLMLNNVDKVKQDLNLLYAIDPNDLFVVNLINAFSKVEEDSIISINIYSIMDNELQR